MTYADCENIVNSRLFRRLFRDEEDAGETSTMGSARVLASVRPAQVDNSRARNKPRAAWSTVTMCGGRVGGRAEDQNKEVAQQNEV